ncbi:hypothetical protein ABVK25_012103 [Lepraria finkii]|uniref:Rhodopsin domain-containing protein n=1 Tax=Lepraria finkii TaxID=1340010 RepID=A0ABR4AI30_9LECA
MFVTLRFYCRKKITKNVWWDDWCILITYLFVLIASCILAAYVSYGGARHTFDIPAAQLPTVTKLNYISQVFHIMGISIGKVAVALLIYRLQAPCRWRTWVLACLSIGVFVTGSLSIILYFLQCTPRQALFNPSLGKCWNPKYMNGYIIADSSLKAMADLVLAFLPITFLWNLQISRRKKVSLAMLLGLGVVAFICAIVKISQLPTDKIKADINWVNVSLLIWNFNEANVVIWAACLPTLMPIFGHKSHNHDTRPPFRYFRLVSIDGKPTRSQRMPDGSPSEDSDLANVLKQGSMEHSGERWIKNQV